MISRMRARFVPALSGGDRGITLVEMVVALSLLTLVLGAIYAFVSFGGRSARLTNDFLQAQAHVRAALDNMVDEIRWAQAVTCASATVVSLLIPQDTPFSATSPYQVTFAHDAARRALVRRQDTAGTGCPDSTAGEALALFVTYEDGSGGLALEYFGADGVSQGSTPGALGSIARVRITITTTRDRTSRTFAGDAALRGR